MVGFTFRGLLGSVGFHHIRVAKLVSIEGGDPTQSKFPKPQQLKYPRSPKWRIIPSINNISNLSHHIINYGFGSSLIEARVRIWWILQHYDYPVVELRRWVQDSNIVWRCVLA